MQSYKDNNNNKISEEEERIRRELEMDIEKDLEGEIKDEIYRLAFRLHRLYQHQRDKQNKVVSEINISINMEGETKIQIKEIKQKNGNNNNKNKLLVHVSKHDSSNKYCADHKKFDWANSLRSGPLKSRHNVVRKKIQIGKEHPRNSKANKCAAKK